MSDRQRVAAITALVGRQFRTFGGGRTDEFNPIANAMKDQPFMFAGMVDVAQVVAFVMDRYDELRRQKSEEWTRIANEPATDEEIASYKRHEGCDGSCLGCLEKFRLIARLEAAEEKSRSAEVIAGRALDPADPLTLARALVLIQHQAMRDTKPHCRSCCYLEAPCDEHKEKQ